MGTNGPTFDHAAHYAGKTQKALQEELRELIDIHAALKKDGDPLGAEPLISRYIEQLRILIAERIGKK